MRILLNMSLVFVLAAPIGSCKTAAPKMNVSDVRATETPPTANATASVVKFKVNQQDDGSISVADDQGSYKCDMPSTSDGKTRIVCHRGISQLDLILKGQDATIAVLFPQGTSGATRTYFRCPALSTLDGSPLICEEGTPVAKVGNNLISPFLSTVPGVSVRNAHVVGSNSSGRGTVLRGMAPLSSTEVDELIQYGIKSVLIFKTAETPTPTNDVTEEMDRLKAGGVDQSKILIVPFKWKGFTDFQEPCEQTIQALAFLKANVQEGVPTFFHCTVGEDRTGYLAGLYRMLTEERSAEDVFKTEMCGNGYSGGNPQKPYHNVVDKIDQDLTPIFLKMAQKIELGQITWDHLDPRVCETETEVDTRGYTCPTSVNYQF